MEQFEDLPSQNLPQVEAAEIGIIRELSPKKVLDSVRWEMRGYVWDSTTKTYKKVEGMKPLMNEKGIAEFLSILSSAVSDVITFSNFEKERVDKLVYHICEESYANIAINYKDFGIPDKSHIDAVHLKILMLSIGALSKAIGAGDRNVVRGTVGENIMNRPIPSPSFNQNQGPKGIFSRLNFSSRREPQ